VAGLAALGAARAGFDGPWSLLVVILAGCALVAALAAMAAARAQNRALEATLARAATAEYERNQLQRDVLRHDQREQQLVQAKQAAEEIGRASCRERE